MSYRWSPKWLRRGSHEHNQLASVVGKSRVGGQCAEVGVFTGEQPLCILQKPESVAARPLSLSPACVSLVPLSLHPITHMTTSLPTQPGFIKLSPEEAASGKWSRANLQRAMELLHRDGLLAMSGIVELGHLEKLRDDMLKTAQEIKKTKTKLTDFVRRLCSSEAPARTLAHSSSVPQNHGVATNFLQSPPLTNPDLLFEDVFSNQFVHQVVEAYLGPSIQLSFITANTALANTKERQPVHKDAPVSCVLCSRSGRS